MVERGQKGMGNAVRIKKGINRIGANTKEELARVISMCMYVQCMYINGISEQDLVSYSNDPLRFLRCWIGRSTTIEITQSPDLVSQSLGQSQSPRCESRHDYAEIPADILLKSVYSPRSHTPVCYAEEITCGRDPSFSNVSSS